MRRAVNAAAPRLLRGVPGVVKEVRAPDGRTVQIVLVQPYAPLLTVLAHPASRSCCRRLPATARRRSRAPGPLRSPRSRRTASCSTPGPGTGRAAPRVGRIVFTATPDAAQAAAALDAQALDLFFPAGAPPRAGRRGLRPGLAHRATSRSRRRRSRSTGRRSATRWPPRSIPRRSRSPSGPRRVPLQGFLPTRRLGPARWRR